MKIDNEVGVLAALDTGYPSPDTLRLSWDHPFRDQNCIWVFSFNFRLQMPQVWSELLQPPSPFHSAVGLISFLY